MRVTFVNRSACMHSIVTTDVSRNSKGTEWGKGTSDTKDLLAMAQTLERDPASSWSPDIAVYKAGARNIDLLFAGKVKIDPLFRFFPVK